MTDIAICGEHCILSEGRQPGVEGLSKLYRIGRAQPHGDSLRSQRRDTLRDAIADF
jgi:hypothetical protein